MAKFGVSSCEKCGATLHIDETGVRCLSCQTAAAQFPQVEHGECFIAKCLYCEFVKIEGTMQGAFRHADQHVVEVRTRPMMPQSHQVTVQQASLIFIK